MKGRSMKLFCREDHSELIIEELNLNNELIIAKANLAKLKKLPISSFTPRINAGFIAEHSVERKDNAIAYAEARIAELEVLVTAPFAPLPKSKVVEEETNK